MEAHNKSIAAPRGAAMKLANLRTTLMPGAMIPAITLASPISGPH